MNLIVTSGSPYTDIDALACAVAYASLLRLEGHETEVVLAPLNQSVTLEIKKWNLNINDKPSLTNFKTVVVDLSDHKLFQGFVTNKNLIEIYDHHVGYEKYWDEKLGQNAKIEFIGACATLIVEEWVKRGKITNIDPLSSNLLYTAILSNTLNFKASLTTRRDIDAFNLLKKHITLSEDWVEQYFKDQQDEILRNPITELKNDVKVIYFKNLDLDIAILQLELWEGKEYLKSTKEKIKELLQTYKKPWFFTLPSIQDGRNYLFANDMKTKKLLETVLSVKFDGDIARTDKLWLRKEILKEIYALDKKDL